MRRLIVLLPMLIPLAAAQDAAPTFETQSKRFEEMIGAMAKVDQKHPDYLTANLDYALLLARAADADCAARIATAQSLYDVVRNSPITPIALPEAAGRVPFAGYSIEMARSRCASDAAEKTPHLLAAQKLAREAVAGYRSAFYYESMAVMQFNVAQSYVDLGDKAQAAKELQVAIDMDRTYGLKRDAGENYRILREWQGQKASDEEVARFLDGVSTKSATLAFAWKPATIQGTADYDLASFEGTDVKHTKFSLPLTGKLVREKDFLVWSLRGGEPRLGPAIGKPGTLDRKMVELLGRLMGKLPTAEIAANGDFNGVRDIDGLVRAMNKEMDDAVAASVPANDPRLPAVKSAVDSALRPIATPDNLLGKFQEEFSLDTGIWIGATLEHGTWMQMPVVMSLNGTPQGFVNQNASFVLSRWLPCGDGKAPTCIELVLDARPDPKGIAEIAQKMAASDQGKFDYAGQTRRRIVVDPATLITYESESIRYGYLAITHNKQRAVKIDADRSLTTWRYSK